MTKEAERAIALALTVDCPDEECRAKKGAECLAGGASMARIVVALVSGLDAAGWPLRDSPEAK